MEQKKINGLIAVNKEQQVVGVFNMHDLLRAGGTLMTIVPTQSP